MALNTALVSYINDNVKKKLIEIASLAYLFFLEGGGAQITRKIAVLPKMALVFSEKDILSKY